jgi:hypothetical protein
MCVVEVVRAFQHLVSLDYDILAKRAQRNGLYAADDMHRAGYFPFTSAQLCIRDGVNRVRPGRFAALPASERYEDHSLLEEAVLCVRRCDDNAYSVGSQRAVEPYSWVQALANPKLSRTHEVLPP